MPKSKTILIWGSENLLSSSIEQFLQAQKGWNVVSILNHEDQDALVQAVETVQPEIVILNQVCHNDLAGFPMFLLQDHPSIKVILVSLELNAMVVYCKQERLIKKAADLIAIIENGP